MGRARRETGSFFVPNPISQVFCPLPHFPSFLSLTPFPKYFVSYFLFPHPILFLFHSLPVFPDGRPTVTRQSPDGRTTVKRQSNDGHTTVTRYHNGLTRRLQNSSKPRKSQFLHKKMQFICIFKKKAVLLRRNLREYALARV